MVRTTTTVDALGRLARVNSERVFFDDVSGGLLQTGRDCVVRAGPLTAHARAGWLGTSWRPERPTDPADPYRPPVPQTTAGPIGIGAGGEVRVAGLEWTGARVLDPATSGFLSPDPMEPTTGAGWTGNPYSYAGNNPANLLDPTGLHPVYAAELDEYRKANSPKWGTALAIAAGVGLAFVPGAQGLGSRSSPEPSWAAEPVSSTSSAPATPSTGAKSEPTPSWAWPEALPDTGLARPSSGRPGQRPARGPSAGSRIRPVRSRLFATSPNTWAPGDRTEPSA
mgnify:CR=1 FL=1